MMARRRGERGRYRETREVMLPTDDGIGAAVFMSDLTNKIIRKKMK